MKKRFFVAIAVFTLTSIMSAQAQTENCAPKSTASKLLKSPNLNDRDPDWSGIGIGWGFLVDGSITAKDIVYKYGHLISPRGTAQPSQVYVIANEWSCKSAVSPIFKPIAVSNNNEKTVIYRGANGFLEVKTQNQSSVSFSLSVGFLTSDRKCSQSEIDCEVIDGVAQGFNGKYKFEDQIERDSRFVMVFSGDSVDISDVHGSMGTGTGNRDILDKIAGRYTVMRSENKNVQAVSISQTPKKMELSSADIANGRLSYRGFIIDVSAAQGNPNFGATESSLKHQIDIVADCGAKPEILEFFRGSRITVKNIQCDKPGSFVANQGVFIDAMPQPYKQPILLHELLYAFYFKNLSGGFQNPEIMNFYYHARQVGMYLESLPDDKYVLKNPQEFFAVTASLYLWGNVDRQPHTREKLKASQPYYYAWLGELFGVQK